MKAAINQNLISTPVYNIDLECDYGKMAEIPDILIQRYIKVTDEFFIIQRELEKLYYTQ